ncbi:DUF4190 domain-containing protein [Asanoa siamensis]|uniref:DUF4190 domain-containing protein n=1 Tax=Asanoa siamensis TaxID=926357 RepID=A0ABQ4CH86_9ACTN|nr:DUF4190 domain-containing protein [Asanoa siamensis]GIF70649.1 hypothetical protein Asi02nite_01670 [Asanoa siamensis]
MTDPTPAAPLDPTAPPPAYPAPSQPGQPDQPGQPTYPGYPAPPQAGPGYPAPAQPDPAYPAPGQPGPAYPASGYLAPAPAYPGYGYAVAKTNTLAIASLVCALAGLVTGLSAPVGAVLGHIARRQIRERGEQGDGLALAGIIVGWILTGLGVAYLLFLLVIIIVAITAGVADDGAYALSLLAA